MTINQLFHDKNICHHSRIVFYYNLNINKITGKIGLSIKLEDTEYENVKYNEEEFIEFRKQIIVAGKKAEDKGLSFSIGRWFIGNYLKNNKIPEKPLKMLLDFEMDTFP